MALSYLRAVELLKNRETKKLANNTYLRRVDATTLAIRLHETDVILIHEAGANGRDCYTLNSGGWRTVTTKERINEFSPASLCQVRGVWLLEYGPRDATTGKRASVSFVDGITVDADGTPETAGDVGESDATLGKKRRLDKIVKAFIDGYVAFMQGQARLPTPNGGDCWGCLMRNKDNSNDEVLGVEHYLTHFAEEYYVPSILWNACQRYRCPEVIWGLYASDVQSGRDCSDRMKADLRAWFKRLKPALLEAFDEAAYQALVKEHNDAKQEYATAQAE